ncbi:MAG: hypothetical protein MI810_04770 [Flavobacteriales bacterium]|nr:hypothetical protein [Flavobacteriales bacterium]
MKKTIIAVYGTSESGKTQSIKQFVANNSNPFIDINGNITTVIPTNSDDIYGTIQIGRALVGITSQGDPGTGLDQRLAYLVSINCDIIICATRTKKQTVWDVNDVERDHGYRKIRFGNFESKAVINQNRLNEISGDGIERVVDGVINGQI